MRLVRPIYDSAVVYDRPNFGDLSDFAGNSKNMLFLDMSRMFFSRMLARLALTWQKLWAIRSVCHSNADVLWFVMGLALVGPKHAGFTVQIALSRSGWKDPCHHYQS